MRFSVIVPVYQVKDYLRQCVDSVLHQTFTDFELILVDDGSTDGSSDICAEYALSDDRVRLIQQPNGGLSSARNTGIHAAKGDYLIFLDSDDFWLTKFGLEEINNRLSDDSVDAVFWRHRKVEESDNTFTDEAADGFSAETCEVPEQIVRFIRSKQLIVCAWDMAVTRGFFSDGSLDFEQGVYSEDVEWLTRLLQKLKSCVFSDMTLNAYRIRQGSITKTLKEKNLIDLNSHYGRIVKYIENADNEDTAGILRAYLGEQGANYILALALSAPELTKVYRDCVGLKYLRYSVTRRARMIKWMARLFGVSGTVFLIKKIKRL
ncbi:MAG: glycosyltransferase [Clostridia bacterium]|nr:glycosyltransferase [Clostridia bacterium]